MTVLLVATVLFIAIALAVFTYGAYLRREKRFYRSGNKLMILSSLCIAIALANIYLWTML